MGTHKCVTRTTEWFDSFQASFLNNTTLLYNSKWRPQEISTLDNGVHRECGVTLLYTALKIVDGVPKGIRTPVTAVKGRCPRPLDDGDTKSVTRTTEWFDSFQASFLNNTTLTIK